MILLPAATTAAKVDDEMDEDLGIMHPGIKFANLVYPVYSPDTNERTFLYAEKAEIRQAPHLMDIHGLRLHRARPSGVFELDAIAAEYNLKTQALRTSGNFRANGLGFHCVGTELVGGLKSRLFELQGRFKIYSEPAVSKPFLQRNFDKMQLSPFLVPLFQPIDSVSAEVMSPSRLVRDFAGNLGEFFDCWRCIEVTNPACTPAVTLMGHHGGTIDFGQIKMKFAGPSAFFGSRSVLVCSGDLDAKQEVNDGEKLVRMMGAGGICMWLGSSKSEETWIRSTSFEHVSDRKVSEFTGGPLIIGRNGMLLQATENWQYVRVFSDQRVILSQGHWNMVGNLVKSDD